MKIKLFTKKDKRTDLDKRIDEVSEKMAIVIQQIGKDENTGMDQEITRILASMEKVDPVCEDHATMVKSLDTLYKARGNDVTQLEIYKELKDSYKDLLATKNAEKSRKTISKDTWIKGGIILASTLIAVYAEDTRVLTSKGLSFLPKMKL